MTLDDMNIRDAVTHSRPLGLSIFVHIALVLAYTVGAVAVALTLPLSVNGIDKPVGVLAGAVAFLFGALMHEILARLRRDRALMYRISRLRQEQDESAADLRGLRTALEAAALRPMAGTPEFDAVVAEVRILQSLVDQLSAGRGAARKPASVVYPPSPPVAPAAAPAPVVAPARDQGPRLTDRPVSRRAGTADYDEDETLELIKEALRSDRVDIMLQPIVSLPQRKHRYYEMFSRIRLAEGNQLMPQHYIEIAERAGFIAAIDNLLLFRCVQLIRETDRRHHDVGFFSNLSLASLHDESFMLQFIRFMEQNPVLATKLVFEMSQEDLLNKGALTSGVLDGLARLGFRFSMDQVSHLDLDFPVLSRHGIRFIKLDAAPLLDATAGLLTDRRLAQIKEEFDRNEIDLIVEKIETEAQLVELLDLKIDYGQGYLFGEPRLSRRAG